NAQSRVFEDVLRGRAPYLIVGGLKFYDRKEIKDAIAYLRALANPADTVSILRVINTPRRGIGQTTIDNLMNAARELNSPLWEILADETSVNTLAGRSAKSVLRFATLIRDYRAQLDELTAAEIVQGIMEDAGYIDDLKKQGTDEADNRLENIFELYNAVVQFQEENEDSSLEAFLAKASLASDLDNLEEGQEAISLMTLHSAKGLEFPVVFLVGLEQGLFPNARTLNDPIALEEERRLCYVGLTRAREQLFLTYTRERALWGSRETAIPSQFLGEIPKELVESNLKSTAKPRSRRGGKTANSERSAQQPATQWNVGDRVVHNTFGEGEVTHIFGSGNKTNLAIKFPDFGQKIIDPRVASMRREE
ncbi:MAG: 3'-5' exonuclease, partial [Cyanobacteriota bacterium]|nr:3'-5' exonuclease [Cyanobacteriota bacterium]